MDEWVKRYKGGGIFPFTKSPSVWGYLNNPRWTLKQSDPVNFDRREGEEPQIFNGSQEPFNKEGATRHYPCGHWHRKKPTGGGHEFPPLGSPMPFLAYVVEDPTDPDKIGYVMCDNNLVPLFYVPDEYELFDTISYNNVDDGYVSEENVIDNTTPEVFEYDWTLPEDPPLPPGQHWLNKVTFGNGDYIIENSRSYNIAFALQTYNFEGEGSSIYTNEYGGGSPVIEPYCYIGGWGLNGIVQVYLKINNHNVYLFRVPFSSDYEVTASYPNVKVSIEESISKLFLLFATFYNENSTGNDSGYIDISGDEDYVPPEGGGGCQLYCGMPTDAPNYAGVITSSSYNENISYLMNLYFYGDAVHYYSLTDIINDSPKPILSNPSGFLTLAKDAEGSYRFSNNLKCYDALAIASTLEATGYSSGYVQRFMNEETDGNSIILYNSTTLAGEGGIGALGYKYYGYIRGNGSVVNQSQANTILRCKETYVYGEGEHPNEALHYIEVNGVQYRVSVTKYLGYLVCINLTAPK